MDIRTLLELVGPVLAPALLEFSGKDCRIRIVALIAYEVAVYVFRV